MPVRAKPHPRQVKLTLNQGPQRATALKELAVRVHGTVRTGPDVLVGFTNMVPGTKYEGRHDAGADLKATLLQAEKGLWRVLVELEYGGSVLPDQLGIFGLSVYDAAGNRSSLTVPRPGPRRTNGTTKISGESSVLTINLPNRGDPTSVVFRGTYALPVSVPLVLKDVPLQEP